MLGKRGLMAALVAGLVFFSILYLSVGSSGCSLFPAEPGCGRILVLRAARLAAAISTGILLAASGTLLQAATRNVLAEPYLLGISSGALVAVSLSLLAAGPGLHPAFLALAAFVGGFAAYTVTAGVAELAGGGAHALILAGVAVTAVGMGFAELLIYMLQSLYGMPASLLLLGTTAYVNVFESLLLSLLAVTAAPVLLLLAPRLNALVLGDDYALQLGVDPKLIRRVAAVVSAVYASSTVAFIGVVGFIGLIAPNIARTLVGGDHRVQAPVSLAIGALLALTSDLAARSVAGATRYGELPLGLYTSILGGVFLAYLVSTRLRRGFTP